MKRKVNRVGQNTLTVSLPSKWVKEMGLKAGDEIELGEKANGLIILTDKCESRSSKTIELLDADLHHLRTLIASLYKTGYDEIIIRFKILPEVDEINKIVNTFTGLEVISYGKNFITINSFLKPGKEQLENLIIKMFQIIKLISSNIEEEWENLDYKKIHSMIKENVIKLRDHCLRIIHSTKYMGDKSYDYYEFVTILEKIAGECLHLSSFVSTNKPKKTKLTQEFSSLLDELYNCYLKKDFTMTNNLWVKIRIISDSIYGDKEINKIIKKEDAGLIVHYYNMMMLFRQLSSRMISLSS